MLYMTSFNIEKGRYREFQAFVQKNEDLLVKHAPPGWTYRGTYGYVLGFGRYSAASLWECKTYGDFDKWREHRDETWGRLAEQMFDFATDEPGESVLLREIGDVRVIEKSKIEEERSKKSR